MSKTNPLRKITQNELAEIITQITPDDIGENDSLNFQKLLENKGFSNDLSGLNFRYNRPEDTTKYKYSTIPSAQKFLAYVALDLSNLNFTDSTLSIDGGGRINFANSNLTKAMVIGKTLNNLSFDDTTLLATNFYKDRTYLGNEVQLLFVTHPFSQSDLMNKHPNLTNNEGVCYGVMMELARYVVKQLYKGTPEEEINVAAKFKRKIDGEKSDNFAFRVQLYWTSYNNYDFKVKVKRNDFINTLSEELKKSDIIGIAFDTFKLKEGKLDISGHVLSVRKIVMPDEKINYEIMDPNYGVMHCTDEVQRDIIINTVINHYQQYKPEDHKEMVTIVRLEEIIKQNQLLPDPQLTPTVNKSKKYAVNELGHSAMKDAIKKDKVDVIKQLIDHGMDINSEFKNTITGFNTISRISFTLPEDSPLIMAIKESNLAAVRELIKAGANVNPEVQKKSIFTTIFKPTAYNLRKPSPLVIAMQKDNVEIARELISAGADTKVLYQKSKLEDLTQNEEMKELLRNPPPPRPNVSPPPPPGWIMGPTGKFQPPPPPRKAAALANNAAEIEAQHIGEGILALEQKPSKKNPPPPPPPREERKR